MSRNSLQIKCNSALYGIKQKMLIIFAIVISKFGLTLGFVDEDRELILDIGTVFKKVDKPDQELWSATYCLRSFFTFYLRSIEQTPIFFATNNVLSRKTDLILRTFLDDRISTYLLSRNLSKDAPYSSSLNAVILVDDFDNFKHPDQPDFMLLCSRQCAIYIVILTREYVDEQEFKSQVKKIIVHLWKKKIGNVMVTGLVDAAFLFSKSRNFKFKESCEPAEPVILGACDSPSPEMLALSQDLFRNIEANWCVLEASYTPRIPYTIAVNDSLVSGVEGEILKAIGSYARFEYSNTVVDNASDNAYFTYGGIPWKPKGRIDFTIPYDVGLSNV